MKVLLLALSLLFFLDFVCSQGNVIPCRKYRFGQCKKGYTVRFSGRNMLHAECYCKKIPPILSRCSSLANRCESHADEACFDMESECSAKEIIDTCNEYAVYYPEICDRANQKLRKENYARVRGSCEFNRDKCNRMLGDHCNTAAGYCDPETTLQLCKNERITNRFTCEAAEIEQEEYRAEDTKYSCDYAQLSCLSNQTLDVCSTIPKLCHADTAAEWCYKDDISQIDKVSDEDCSRVVKKSQDLMFGESKQECWEQVPLCEGGDSEACIQVASLCVKEVTSALCNAKKITSERICKYAVLEETTDYPGCKFFADKCGIRGREYCQLASRYCDNDTINSLCRKFRITDRSICKKAKADNSTVSPPV